jgi:hypothetical protein
MDEVLDGRAPNAGRFCGHCYHPAAAGRAECSHCGASTEHVPPVEKIPLQVLVMHKRRRSREGLVVRTIAWTGLTLGVIVSLLPLAIWDVSWGTGLAFVVILLFFYLLSANLANSVGDSLGYRWGQAVIRSHWTEFLRERDGE